MQRRPSPIVCAALVCAWLAGIRPVFAQSQALSPPVAPQRAHRVDVGAVYNALSKHQKDHHEEAIRWTAKLGKASAVFGAAAFQDRFDRRDTHLTAGALHNFTRGGVWGSFTAAPDAEVVSSQEYDLGGSYRIRPKLSGSGQYSYRKFPGGLALQMFMPGVSIVVNPKVVLLGQYVHMAITGDHSHSGIVNVMWTPKPPLTLVVGGGAGNEHYLSHTTVEVQRRADAYSLDATAIWRYHANRGLRVSYMFQDRTGFYATNAFIAGVYAEF